MGKQKCTKAYNGVYSVETDVKHHRMTAKYFPSFKSLEFPVQRYDSVSRLSPIDSDIRSWDYMSSRSVNDVISYPRANGSVMDLYNLLWNLAHFPSLVNAIIDNGHIFDGVTLPYSYLGMLYSIFAFHIEDLSMFSLNYLYWGARKSSTSIAVPWAPRFEKLHQLLYRTTCRNPLSHKTSVIDA